MTKRIPAEQLQRQPSIMVRQWFVDAHLRDTDALIPAPEGEDEANRIAYRLRINGWDAEAVTRSVPKGDSRFHREVKPL